MMNGCSTLTAVAFTSAAVIAAYLTFMSKTEKHPLIKQDDAFLAKYSESMSIRDKSLNVFRIPYKYATEMDKKKPTIVFIHGVGGQLAQFIFQLRHFVNMANVIALDFVGFGHSEKSLNYDHYVTDSIIEDIMVVIKTHNVSSDLAVSEPSLHSLT